jgi:hypothetical protein
VTKVYFDWLDVNTYHFYLFHKVNGFFGQLGFPCPKSRYFHVIALIAMCLLCVSLSQRITASREAIGKNERNGNLRSIKMARPFGVMIDFLIESGENASYDKETVERFNDIQKMNADTKNVLFNVIDTYIQNFKTKQAFLKG